MSTATRDEQPLLRVRDLTVGFTTAAGETNVVKHLDFDLARGGALGIVGESGSGKSMTSLAVMGLLPKGAKRTGSIELDGTELTTLRERQMQAVRGDRIAMVFQDPLSSLNPYYTVGTQIMEAYRSHRTGVTRRAARKIAIEAMERVHIKDAARRVDHYPHQFSGGMRQRVMIAMTLSMEPDLIIADEPTTALDVTVQAQILDLLANQQRERFMAMMLITHDLGVVAGRTDEIAVMYAGRIVEKAPTKVLFSNVKMPYTEALLRSIPKIENPSHTRLLAISGRPPDLVTPPVGCKFAPRCLYAQERCREEEPPLMEADTAGHLYRCWYPVGTPEGKAALQKNLKEKETAVGVDVSALEVSV
jgi:peptide/nickel transport system ATP-binding protein